MADVMDLGNVTVTVGEAAEYILAFEGDAPDALWLECDDDSVALPMAADGTQLTWPYQVTLTDGGGTYFILGISPGMTEYYFQTSNDPNDADSFASASITVTVPEGGDGSSGTGTGDQVLTIAEPIVITIIAQPPANTASV